ncbi:MULTISPECIES: MerR family transcriptional regulator [Cryobacterium]|uniref:MerR family transcriptional regulator n=1 Tax=Cryobacterium glucosi TaxID=1259175 RepID=A0ABY2IN84_9MICO|nr:MULTISPECIES: MerR family transcriptional regulator [Cryobacterium]MEB0001800.1 MerR family transcriptional regulator [Cryobacterium sp. RTC2.1]MEB0201492.1 MerR family transcriptional regulator [Cryobacterium sp. 5I3]MEB0285767.1 MerR family transcriptional regulator [Cryobacterium sp. 10S3]MEB0290347.1 MerR family transcriptional regulator [Cryobacterium sp. 10C2]TFB99187.1 MerR family transcriptional regulator [Cryobacterium sp. MDB2-A-1]
MRMAELSTRSGTAVATIKYYQRENLLAGGERSGPNQALYAESHLERIRLIRGLTEVGGLSVAAVRRVLEAIDSELSLPETFEIAQHSVSATIDESAVSAKALARVDALTAGWHVSAANPGRLAAARVVDTFAEVGQTDARGWFDRYAAAALLAAEADIDELDARVDRAAKGETVVVGTVLGDKLFSGLRRAAQEHIAALRYGMPPEAAPEPAPGSAPEAAPDHTP